MQARHWRSLLLVAATDSAMPGLQLVHGRHALLPYRALKKLGRQGRQAALGLWRLVGTGKWVPGGQASHDTIVSLAL